MALNCVIVSTAHQLRLQFRPIILLEESVEAGKGSSARESPSTFQAIVDSLDNFLFHNYGILQHQF